MDIQSIRTILARLAMSDDRAASRAVKQSMLAIASLHRDGNRERAAQHKMLALRAMRVSKDNLDAKEGLQHVAAGMLLLTLEVLRLLSSS